jgi:hypothetical protein
MKEIYRPLPSWSIHLNRKRRRILRRGGNNAISVANRAVDLCAPGLRELNTRSRSGSGGTGN